MGIFVISLLAGAAAAMGLGGGTLLIVYLSAFTTISQTAAQGINLIFFIPTAAAATFLYARSGLIDTPKALSAAAVGTLSALVFSLLASKLSADWSRNLFGAFILLVGMKQLVQREKK